MTVNSNKVMAITAADLTTPSSTSKYDVGMRYVQLVNGYEEEYVYANPLIALAANQAYEIKNTGTTLAPGAPATGAGEVGVAPAAFTAGYYGFLKTRGIINVKKSTGTPYAQGDHVELNVAESTYAAVDGTSGSTVRTVNSFGVCQAAATTAQSTVSVYMYGNSVTTIAGS